MKEYKFFVITDTHYYSPKLPAFGKDYDERMDFEQKCFAETAAINKAVFDYLAESDFSDTVLIAGDLTFNGERQSHIDFSQFLKSYKEKGLRFLVATASHDVSITPKCYSDKGVEPVEHIEFDELLDFYHEFGYDEAIELNKEHMSYVADINDEIRLLVLCNDTAEGRNIPYSDEYFAWMEAQAKKAQADGKMMIAMEHYPVIAGQPVLGLIRDANQQGAPRLIETLADNGVHLIFTGHMHNQSINVETTAKGNKFYDVCTGSTIGCPAFIRKITVKENGSMQIESVPVPDFEWDTKGKTCQKYLQDIFEGMIRNLVYSMQNDPDRVLRKVGAGDKTSLRPLVKVAGHIFSKWTLGKICRMLFVKAEPEAKNITLVNFAVDLVRNIFCGDQPFTEGTPVGDTFLRLLDRAKPILNKKCGNMKDVHGRKIDIYDVLKNSAGNYGISDNNATLTF